MKLFVLCALVLVQQTLAIRDSSQYVFLDRKNWCEFKVEQFFDGRLRAGIDSFSSIKSASKQHYDLHMCFKLFSDHLEQFIDTEMPRYCFNYVDMTMSQNIQYFTACDDQLKRALGPSQMIIKSSATRPVSEQIDSVQAQVLVQPFSGLLGACFNEPKLTDILRQVIFSKLTVIYDAIPPSDTTL